jgi:ABC-2 type transport system ATP-binding protein
MNEFAIQAINVSAHYANGQKRIDALKNVSLEVRRGEIFGLLGPNSAGKTTLLSCIQALHKPETGSVTVGGLDVAQHSAQTKRMLGIQLQRTALLDGLRATELIEAYASLYDIFVTPDQIAELLKRFDLSDQADKLARQMSGGQQQRLSLAIATDPQIVLLDEPTEALDPGARRGVWAMIRQLKEQGRTVVLTTHSMDEAESLCGRVAIMDRGRVVACDTPQKLIAKMGVNPMLKATIELPLEQVQPLAGAMAARLFIRKSAEHSDARARLITELQQAYRELAAAREQEAELAALKERERIARDMHDSLGHALVSLSVQLEAAQRLYKKDPKRASAQMDEMKAVTRQSMDALRRTLAGLRAPGLGDRALRQAIQEMSVAVSQRSGVAVNCRIAPEADRLSPTVAEAIWGVTQEALTNIEKHAQARRAEVQVNMAANALALRICDDGVGLPADAFNKAGHYGLRGMRERVEGVGGTLTVGHNAGAGTCVEANIPLI